MRRISVEDVLAAYEKTGLEPAETGDAWYRGNCACAIGALMCADERVRERGGRPYKYSRVGTPAKILRLEPVYVSGFSRGFDGNESECDAVKPENHESYCAGYEDGLAVRRALWPTPPAATDEREE
jgi:hypothetical protein